MKIFASLMLGSLLAGAAIAQAPAGGGNTREVKVVAIGGKIERKGPCGPAERDLQAGDHLSVTCALIASDPEAFVELECGNAATQMLSNQFVAVVTAGGVPSCAIRLERGTAIASSSPDGGPKGSASIDSGLLSANSTHTQFGVTVPDGKLEDAEAFVLEGEASVKRGGEVRTLSNGQLLYARTLKVTALPDARLKLYANDFARVATANASAKVTVTSRNKLAESYYQTWKRPDDGNVRATLVTELETLAVAPSSLTRYQTVRARRLNDMTTQVRPVAPMAAAAAGVASLERHEMFATTTFTTPTTNNYRVDICLHWGTDCGQPAANRFCASKGYSSATAFDIDNDVGGRSPTLVLGDNKVCNAPSCDAFKSVSCR